MPLPDVTTVLAPNDEVNRDLAAWLAMQLGLAREFRAPYRTMGIFAGSELIAVAIWENYIPEHGTVEIGGGSVSTRWLTPKVLKAVADFTFRDLGCQMAVFRTGEKNAEARRFLDRFKIPFTVIPRLRGRDEAEIFYHLTDTDWHQSRLGKRMEKA